MKYNPHDYQEFTTQKMIDTPHFMALLDMGLGKTVITLTALNEMMFNSFEINKVLVIAPLRVAEMTWSEEIEKWDHLKNIVVSKIIGSEKQRIEALYKHADIFCINRENTQWLIDYSIKKKKWIFDCIVIDESSSFKNSQSKRFKALRKVTAIVPRIILLTGTPAPNSLMDLWSQMYLIDAGQRLGRTITAYRQEFFTPGRRNRNVVFEYVPRPEAEQKIYGRIKDVAVSLKATDYIKMPERIDIYIKLQMPKRVETLYQEMEKEYIITLNEEDITAASAAVVCGKLLQMANGAVYTNEKNVIAIHDLKLDALQEILDDNPGKPIMVFYNFQHDLDRLLERFKEENPRRLLSTEDKKDWDNHQIRLLLAHPASMGHGLNLQAGGNIIVWFGLTNSLELYQQANARLYRQGQKETVIINHLIVKDTEDENVIKRLQSKRLNQDELIEAVKAKIRKYKEETL